jgi:transposase
MATYVEMEERISKQQLQKMYGVNRTTIEEWVKRFGLPMIEISSHKKYILKSDLIKWEDSKKYNKK